MKRREMKQAAKENLRGRRIGPFFMCLFFLFLSIPAAVCSFASTMLSEYVEMVEEQSVVIAQLAHLDVATLLSYAAILSAATTVFYYLIDTHAQVGLARYFIRFGREKAGLGAFLGGFFRKYFRTMWVYFLTGLKLILWTLCFIIPGLIKAVEYSMLHFVMADNPDLSTREIYRETRALMKGCKWKFFWLEFSFIGWYILCALTCGLAVPFFLPYHSATLAEFYHYAKDRQANKDTEA